MKQADVGGKAGCIVARGWRAESRIGDVAESRRWMAESEEWLVRVFISSHLV